MPRDRGPYTCVYAALMESPEYDALSRNAADVWWSLKLHRAAGQCGILQVFRDELARRSKVPGKWIPGALRELVEGRWIQAEGNWVWLRNHLRFSPGFQPANPNHVAGLVNQVGSLPKINLVCDFVAYYKELGYLPQDLECETRNPNPIAIDIALYETKAIAIPARSRGRVAVTAAANLSATDRDETRALINAYNEVLKAHISFTPGNLKAADRMYGSGYTLEQAKTVFAAVMGSQTPTAAWCHDNNREYEYLIRPQYRSTRSQELVPAVIDKVLNELGSGRLVERRAI